MNDDSLGYGKGLCSHFWSVMFMSLVSDALLITLSWCIRGENTSWCLNPHTLQKLQHRRITFNAFFYFVSFSKGGIWRWRASWHSHHAQPRRSVLLWLKLLNLSLFLCYPRLYVYTFSPSDSNNSGDNLYTMINTGPGNRNNVSSVLFLWPNCWFHQK